ncbi:hypothetical protein HDE_08426 [Halotydeus destructor]|nr:hypothetical protein HDE_08426 [Halotydeus destructor]
MVTHTECNPGRGERQLHRLIPVQLCQSQNAVCCLTEYTLLALSSRTHLRNMDRQHPRSIRQTHEDDNVAQSPPVNSPDISDSAYERATFGSTLYTDLDLNDHPKSRKALRKSKQGHE